LVVSDPLCAFKVTYDGHTPTIHDDRITKLELNQIYQGGLCVYWICFLFGKLYSICAGCAQQLEDLFLEEAKQRGEELRAAQLDVVYVGDHPLGDVRAAQQCCRAWRAVSVTEGTRHHQNTSWRYI
jgi:hypothetical protein